MSLVIWERRVKTIGYLSLKGKAEFSGHPPTLTVPCSSIDHRSLIIGSNLDRELLLLILAFRSLRLRLNSWMLSVVILLIYAFPFLVVQLLWWWLSSTCSSWKFLSYNLSIWLPLPVGEPWHAVDAAKIHPDCSRAHNSLNLRFSYLNIKTFSAYKWKFLSHRNTGPLRQLDLISSSSFPRHFPEPWLAGVFFALMYRKCESYIPKICEFDWRAAWGWKGECSPKHRLILRNQICCFFCYFFFW